MSVIQITIPPYFQREVTYAIDCLFGEFLGVAYTVEEGREANVRMTIGDKQIVSRFFSSQFGAGQYPAISAPQVQDTRLVINDRELPCLSLFGDWYIEESAEGFEIGGNLLWSTFYMLSRYGEVQAPEDQHGRFSAASSVACQHGFLHRPIVNEYTELFGFLFLACGYQGPFKRRTYEAIPTHDVDLPFLWSSRVKRYAAPLSSMLRGHIGEAGWFARSIVNGIDPFDRYDILMDRAEEVDQRALFYILVNGSSEFDGNFDINHPKVVALIKHIIDRGHEIGLHPSYDSYLDERLLREQKQRLEQVVGDEVLKSRQHFLRCRMPDTLRYLEAIGISQDSTLGYADHVGFRCGVCYPFPVFDIEQKATLDIIEQPLILMDASLKMYQKVSTQEGLHQVQRLQDQVKKYNGQFVFLWHNSSIRTAYYEDAEEYLDVLYR